ncbi:hypothetical protein Gotur_024290 [Gossypium turneri]
MELCSFSPCIEQVQLHVKLLDLTLQHHELLLVICTNIWTFEMLLHMYEIREWKLDHLKVNDGNSTACPPRKRRQPSSEASVGDNASSPTVMAWPSVET